MVKKIKIFRNFEISKAYKKSLILVGNFDGLHVGHQKLFKQAQKYKIKFKLKIGVITFDPIPKMFFNKKLKNLCGLSLPANFQRFLVALGSHLYILAVMFDKRLFHHLRVGEFEKTMILN